MFIVVVLKNGSPLSIPVENAEAARVIVNDAHAAMNAGRAVKIPPSAVLAHDEIAAMYAADNPATQSETRSLFDAVFGTHR